MADRTEWKRLRQQIQEQGFQLEQGTKHWKIRRGRELVCVMATTPGRGRALLNQKAQLRRAGIKI